MQKKPLPKNLILIGFMGTGKSTIGYGLSRRLDWPFIDTDHQVVETAGLSIPEIFELHGEKAFRDIESETLAQVLAQSGQIIATGGGIVQREENRALIRQNGYVIWLMAAEEAIVRRVTRNKNRPLVQTTAPAETVHRLLVERQPLYAALADLKVDTTLLGPQRIITSILKAL